MILFMSADSPPLSPTFAIEFGTYTFVGPVVGLSNADGVALKTYLAAHPGLTVSIDLAGIDLDLNTYSQAMQFSPPVVANQLASYSSLGPNAGDGAIKPEIVATDDFGDTVDVEYLGAGRLDAGLAANANVTLQVSDFPPAPTPTNYVAPATTTLNFGILKTGATLPITKQIQITNSGSSSVTLAVAVATETAAAGTTITTDKSTVSLAAGATWTFND